MNIFNDRPQTEEQKQVEQQVEIDPHFVIINGDKLIKLVEDNPDIPEGQVRKGLPMGNYLLIDIQ